MPLKLPNGVVDGLGLQDCILQLKEEPFFDDIGTLLQVVCTSATISILRTTVFWIKMLATASDDCHIRPTDATLHQASQQIRTRV